MLRSVAEDLVQLVGKLRDVAECIDQCRRRDHSGYNLLSLRLAAIKYATLSPLDPFPRLPAEFGVQRRREVREALVEGGLAFHALLHQSGLCLSDGVLCDDERPPTVTYEEAERYATRIINDLERLADEIWSGSGTVAPPTRESKPMSPIRESNGSLRPHAIKILRQLRDGKRRTADEVAKGLGRTDSNRTRKVLNELRSENPPLVEMAAAGGSKITDAGLTALEEGE